MSIIMGLTRCYKTTAFVGSKSLCSCCIYSGGSWACFFGPVTVSPNRNLCGWNMEHKWQASRVCVV